MTTEAISGLSGLCLMAFVDEDIGGALESAISEDVGAEPWYATWALRLLVIVVTTRSLRLRRRKRRKKRNDIRRDSNNSRA